MDTPNFFVATLYTAGGTHVAEMQQSYDRELRAMLDRQAADAERAGLYVATYTLSHGGHAVGLDRAPVLITTSLATCYKRLPSGAGGGA